MPKCPECGEALDPEHCPASRREEQEGWVAEAKKQADAAQAASVEVERLRKELAAAWTEAGADDARADAAEAKLAAAAQEIERLKQERATWTPDARIGWGLLGRAEGRLAGERMISNRALTILKDFGLYNGQSHIVDAVLGIAYFLNRALGRGPEERDLREVTTAELTRLAALRPLLLEAAEMIEGLARRDGYAGMSAANLEARLREAAEEEE
jgi:hypothetical protein